MEYEAFCKSLKKELPLNRKECFYTGTVLPELLFHKGLNNFYAFLRLIEGFPKTVGQATTGDNFIFYTEYNLKESAREQNIWPEKETPTGETPDLVIEILEPEKILVVVEGKMFAKVTEEELFTQMASQERAVIRILKKQCGFKDHWVFHLALLPRALGIERCGGHQVVYWDMFIENKEFNVQDSIFLRYLKYALENYDALVQRNTWGPPPAHVEGYLSGREVYENGKQGGSLWVGRRGGRNTFLRDVQTGKWERKSNYPISSSKPSKGIPGQWITSAEFARMVDTHAAS